MVKIVVQNFSEDALRKLYCDLDNREFRWDDDCELCSMPTLLHSGKGTCTRMSVSELNEAWSLFRKKMKPIRNWYTDIMDREWKCNLCKKQYECIKELDEHLKKEHGIRIFKCLECGKGFEHLEELIVHQENCYICEQCDNWYESR